MNIIWKWQSFKEIKTEELYGILQLRQLVFVLEQNCLYQDLDNRDQTGFHLSAWSRTSKAVPVAYLRVLPGENNTVRIGRVVTHPAKRAQGLGRQLFQRGIDAVERCWPGITIQISAQHHLEGFYKNFGFKRVSDVFLEDNIPHVEMIRKNTP